MTNKTDKYALIREHFYKQQQGIREFMEATFEMYGFKNPKSMKVCLQQKDITERSKKQWLKENQNVSYGVIKEFSISKVKNFGFEESLGNEYLSFKLPDEIRKIGVISDVHYPFHDLEALTIAIQYLLKEEIQALYLNGDIFDFYSISRHEKDPDLRDFPREVEMCRNFLQKLRDLFPTIPIYYKIGNHEDRYMKSLMINAEEFARIEDMLFDKFFRLDKLGIPLIESWQGTEMGDLLVLHGHELYGGGGVNPAQGTMNKTLCNTLIGHVHRTSTMHKKNGLKQFISTYSTGCLTILSPKYMPFSMHNHGFAVVEIDDNGKSFVKNIRMENYKIVN